VLRPSREELQSICKIGTGFKDEELVALSDSLRPTIIDAPRPYYKVWFSALLR
jgi:DNA ligase-1